MKQLPIFYDQLTDKLRERKHLLGVHKSLTKRLLDLNCEIADMEQQTRKWNKR